MSGFGGGIQLVTGALFFLHRTVSDTVKNPLDSPLGVLGSLYTRSETHSSDVAIEGTLIQDLSSCGGRGGTGNLVVGT